MKNPNHADVLTAVELALHQHVNRQTSRTEFKANKFRGQFVSVVIAETILLPSKRKLYRKVRGQRVIDELGLTDVEAIRRQLSTIERLPMHQWANAVEHVRQTKLDIRETKDYVMSKQPIN